MHVRHDPDADSLPLSGPLIGRQIEANPRTGLGSDAGRERFEMKENVGATGIRPDEAECPVAVVCLDCTFQHLATFRFDRRTVRSEFVLG